MNKKTLLIIFCALLSLLIILFSYKTVLANTSLSANQQSTIDYLVNDEYLGLNYTTLEVDHLNDVKVVMNYANIIFYILLIGLFIFIKYYLKQKEELKKLLYYGGLTTVISLTIILFSTLLFFNQIFTLFHLIFFSQGNWTFAFNSLLITTFPIEFFMSFSFWTFLISLFVGLIIIYISKKMK